MINLPTVLHKVRSRSFLIGLALLLLLFNLAKISVNYFRDQQAEVASRVALLDQQRKSVARIDELRVSVSSLAARKAALDHYLFKGESEARVASAMQIMLQEMVSKANLDPESLRPILRGRRDEKDKKKEIHGIAIKLRLSGDIQGFLDFLASLYRSDRLFVIDNFILRPDRNDKLQIMMDLKGFYRLAKAKAAGPVKSSG